MAVVERIPEAHLELRGVVSRYGERTALDGVDLEVGRGETVVLLGTSGCGKSTVLRLLLGLIRPVLGEVRFDASPVSPERVFEIRRKMGYVVQGGGLFPHLTARGNVTLLSRHLGHAPDRIEGRLAELLELTGLPPDALERFPSQLSGGQAQRVSLMRALMQDPEVLLLDEPLGALDPMTRFQLQSDLREIFQRLRKSVCLVTHDLAEAAFFADRIVLMHEGRVVQQGTLLDLVERPADPFVTRFVSAQRSSLLGAVS